MKIHSGFVFAVILAAVALGACGCRAEAEPEPWNVVFITLDTTRADHLSCYGHSSPTTPNLDALAADGSLFENCLTPVPITLPSHATLFSGTYPSYHGVRENGGFYVPDGLETLAEILQDAGWTTAAIVGSFPVSSTFNIDQGFETFDDRFFYATEDTQDYSPASKIFFEERKADKVARAAIDWLRDDPGEPFLLWLHFFDPHQPHDAPSPFAELFPGSPYDAEIALTDDCIGAFLTEMKRLGHHDRTIYVVVGDHGEGLGQHGELTHALMVYNSTLQVPLILKVPGLEPRRIGGTVRTLDVLPTLCELLDLPTPSVVQGTSLVRALTGVEKLQLETYHETLFGPLRYRWSPLFAITKEGWKYIDAPQPELYHVAEDPKEEIDLIGEHSEQAARLKERLDELREEIRGADADQATTWVDPGTMAKLEALGYIGAGGLPSGGMMELERLSADMVNPHRDEPELFPRITEARSLIAANRYQRALDIIDSFISIDPGNPDVRHLQFIAHLGLEHWEEALAAAREYMRLDPENPRAFLSVGMALRGMDRKDEALEPLRRATEIDPRNPDNFFWYGVASESLGNHAEAESAYRAVLDLDAEHDGALINLADVLALEGKAEEALAVYDRTIAVNPYLARAHHNRGLLLTVMARPDDARRSFERALKIRPYHVEATFALAILEHNTGEIQSCSQHLERVLELDGEGPLADQAREILEQLTAEEAEPHGS